MHFHCRCGNRLNDITDHISYKAHMIADQDWEDFLNQVEEAIQSPKPDREKVIMNFYYNSLKNFRLMYQCTECGQIYIDDTQGNMHSFRAELHAGKRLLQSAKGINWKGCLIAEWVDEKPKWSEHNGMICPEVNDCYKACYFDDFEEFQEKYKELFEELKAKNILRYARMKRNNTELHYWSDVE